jgi:hypothetical protein
MRSKHKKFTVIALLVFAVILCAVQAEVWAQSTSHTSSETDTANTVSQQPPSEIAGLAGTCLLVVAGVVASIPLSRNSGK